MFKRRKITGAARAGAAVEEPKPAANKAGDHSTEPDAAADPRNAEDPHPPSDPATPPSDPAVPPTKLSAPPKPPKAEPRAKGVTIVTDFEHNICKEFAKSGYCGFGDTCKFLHIRDLHPKSEPAKKVSKPQEPRQDSCPLCSKKFTQPVVTDCGHQFCLDCFLQQCKKSTKCFKCATETSGSCLILTNKNA